MGIEKMILLVCELDYQQNQSHEKTIPYDLLCKPWEVVDIYAICIVDYYSKLPIMKKADGMSADNLIRAAMNMSVEVGLPKK